jgi:hypothetical protein
MLAAAPVAIAVQVPAGGMGRRRAADSGAHRPRIAAVKLAPPEAEGARRNQESNKPQEGHWPECGAVCEHVAPRLKIKHCGAGRMGSGQTHIDSEQIYPIRRFKLRHIGKTWYNAWYMNKRVCAAHAGIARRHASFGAARAIIKFKGADCHD